MNRLVNPDVETTDWRAVCGRPASTVRREGRPENLPYPYRLKVFYPSYRRKPVSSDFGLKYFMPKKGYLYILASRRNGTLYVGVTSDLAKRIKEHRLKMVDGFTKRYGITKLVYFEMFEDIKDAIARERQVKEWRREWKTELIQSSNPYWRDLYEDIL